MCEVAPGRKRSFDDILMMIEWIEAHRLDESEVDNYEPYDVFRNRRLSENARLSPGEVQAEFLAMVEDSDIPCKYARNQWLVPHFVGVEVRRSNPSVCSYRRKFRPTLPMTNSSVRLHG